MILFKNIFLCFGTRPEAIKMAPLYHELKKHGFKVRVCVTAQHREMLDQVLRFFKIVPDYDLNLMQPNQTLNELSAQILKRMDGVFNQEKPDLVLVHGDTTTSAMVALAAFHKKIKIGHIEAGLRTYNKNAPFPEEINRQITARITDYHFAPTTLASSNLLAEKILSENIIITGNTVIDALFLGLAKIDKNPQLIQPNIVEIFAAHSKVILTTIHRRENFGEGLESICNALQSISENQGVKILIPLHLNPMVQEPVNRILGKNPNILLIEPLDYPNFIYAMSKSYLIMTDSGGVQEEAPSLGKPVLVLRDATERPEAIDAGTVKLVGTDKKKIVEETNNLLNDKEYYSSFTKKSNPYGNGTASETIVNFIKKLK